MSTIPAAKFKAECLALMDQVQKKGARFKISKHGRVVAQLIPVEEQTTSDPLAGFYIGGKILGDISGPVVPLSDYEALK